MQYVKAEAEVVEFDNNDIILTGGGGGGGHRPPKPSWDKIPDNIEY